MILNIENMSGHREQYVINSFRDFNVLAEVYPQVSEIARDCHTLKEAAEEVAAYLSNSHLDAWVEETNPLIKGIKDKAIALGISAATMLHPAPAIPGIQKPAEMTQMPARFTESDFGKKPEDRFLHAIMQLESSGGKNLDHDLITYGKYKGQKAIGKWALLKPTLDEFIQRRRTAGTLTSDLEKVGSMSRDAIANHFKENPHVELEFARDMAKHVIGKHNGDLLKAAYSWRWGHNLSSDEIADDNLTHEYVRDFARHYKKSPFKNVKPAKVNKLVKNKYSLESFDRRLKEWVEHRDELKRVKMVQSNDVPDPGRIRDKDLDAPVANKEDLLARVKEAIKQAKKS